MSKTDVIIIGGGMVGLALAAALSKATFKVTVVESKEPPLEWDDTDYDARVSAINLASYRFLNYLGVWSDLRPACVSSMEHMVVWDAVGGGEIKFDAAEMNKEVLGYIVENREIVRVLWEQLLQDNNVELVLGLSSGLARGADFMTLDCQVKPDHDVTQTLDHQINRDNDVVRTLGDRIKYDNDIAHPADCQIQPENDVVQELVSISAPLIVGADGARSWLRDQMSVEVEEKPYQHNAVVAVIKTEKPHAHTALQPFLKTGPLGVLPLGDTHHVGIVWSTNPSHSEELIKMSLDDFNRKLTNALGSRLGTMHCVSERKAIPLTMRHAKHYIEKQLALVGDAAHTIHPLAGQGANLGFMDAACLAETLQKARENEQNIGNARVLRRYERWRKGDNTLMLLAMRGFKECFAEQSPLLVTMRSLGLNMTNRWPLLKKCFMQAALNDSDDLPQSVR